MPSRRRPEPSLRVLKPKGKGPDTTDLAKLEAAVNATSQRAVAQWVAFLSLWAYLFFTTLSVTDRDLILLTPVKLPLIGVELGLQAFFWVGPPLFWVFHLYLTRKVVVLAADIAFYRDQISRQIHRPNARVPLLQRLDAFFLTRWLGYPEQGNGLRLLDGIIAAVTCAVLPLVLMMTFQIRFLVFHDVEATWWHRGWALADLLIVLFLTAKALKTHAPMGEIFSITRTVSYALGLALKRVAVFPIAAGYMVTALFVATVPDEAMSRLVPISSVESFINLKRNLNPKDTDFVDDAKIELLQYTVNLSNRDLRFAKLDEADLRKANLENTNLYGASLKKAKLQYANLGKSNIEKADLSFSYVNNSILPNETIKKAILHNTDVSGQDFSEFDLNGVNLSRSIARGTNFHGALLNGADLSESQMQGANLAYAELKGASLFSAQLQGADMSHAIINGSICYNSQFQGADLFNIDGQGVNFSEANFHGANFSQAKLNGSDFSGAKFWKTIYPDDKNNDANYRKYRDEKKAEKYNMNLFDPDNFYASPVYIKTPDTLSYDMSVMHDMIDKWILYLPAGNLAYKAQKRLSIMVDDNVDSEPGITEKYIDISQNARAYREKNAEYIAGIACNDKNKYILNNYLKEISRTNYNVKELSNDNYSEKIYYKYQNINNSIDDYVIFPNFDKSTFIKSLLSSDCMATSEEKGAIRYQLEGFGGSLP